MYVRRQNDQNNSHWTPYHVLKYTLVDLIIRISDGLVNEKHRQIINTTIRQHL